MTTKEAAIIIESMIVKGQAVGLYSPGEIFAYNSAITKLQENEHSQNKGSDPNALPKEVTTN